MPLWSHTHTAGRSPRNWGSPLVIHTHWWGPQGGGGPPVTQTHCGGEPQGARVGGGPLVTHTHEAGDPPQPHLPKEQLVPKKPGGSPKSWKGSPAPHQTPPLQRSLGPHHPQGWGSPPASAPITCWDESPLILRTRRGALQHRPKPDSGFSGDGSAPAPPRVRPFPGSGTISAGTRCESRRSEEGRQPARRLPARRLEAAGTPPTRGSGCRRRAKGLIPKKRGVQRQVWGPSAVPAPWFGHRPCPVPPPAPEELSRPPPAFTREARAGGKMPGTRLLARWGGATGWGTSKPVAVSPPLRPRDAGVIFGIVFRGRVTRPPPRAGLGAPLPPEAVPGCTEPSVPSCAGVGKMRGEARGRGV